MKNVKDKLKFLEQLLTKGVFPNDHNRIWTMCKATVQMAILTVAEAERCNMINKQFYIEFENILNELSVKDHNKDDVSNIENGLKKFMADQGDS